MVGLLAAFVLGLLQGILEWLPISSEGHVAAALTLVGNATPAAAVQLSLFLHVGTAVAATAYYRDVIADVVRDIPDWRPGGAFDVDRAELSYYAIATVVSGFVGVTAYVLLVEAVSELSGGAFLALVGVLLVATGLVQYQGTASGRNSAVDPDEGEAPHEAPPDLIDALAVGVLQGVAILPGVSRSGTTAGALLIRGHQPEAAFRLSFVLSIPAALGAGVLAVLDAGGLPGIEPVPAVVALATSAVVGLVTIDALVRVVRRVAFWAVCLGLGTLAILGGLLVVI